MRIPRRYNVHHLIGLYLTSICIVQHSVDRQHQSCSALSINNHVGRPLHGRRGGGVSAATGVPHNCKQVSSSLSSSSSSSSSWKTRYYHTQSNQQHPLPRISSSSLSCSPPQEPTPPSPTRSLNLSITAILVSTSLNLLGFTMTSPLTPTLGQHFRLTLGASFGSLTSAYPLGMLFGLFLWPRLSDSPRVGRKAVMAMTLLGSALGLGLQSWAVVAGWTLERFLWMRAFTGCFAGSSPVAKAFLADLVGRVGAVAEGDRGGSETDGDASERQTDLLSKYLAWRDASSTLAYIIGPAIGGIVYAASLHALPRFMPDAAGSVVSSALAFVIGLSALASFVAATLVTLLVRDEHQPAPTAQTKPLLPTQPPSGPDPTYSIISCPLGKDLYTGVATVCVVSFLYHVADSTFFAFFPALLQHHLHLDARAIGLAFTGFASISFAVSASSLSALSIKKLGVVNTCALGLSTIGLGLSALSLVASTTLTGGFLGGSTLPLAAAALYFCGVPLYGPTIPTMLLQCVPPYRRGAVMGLDGAVNTVARVVSPIVVGDLYRRRGAGAAFGVASAAVFGSAGVALVRRLMVVREERGRVGGGGC